MFVLAVVSGLVAPLSIMLTKWTVDGVTRFAAGEDVNIIVLALAWAAVAMIG